MSFFLGRCSEDPEEKIRLLSTETNTSGKKENKQKTRFSALFLFCGLGIAFILVGVFVTSNSTAAKSLINETSSQQSVAQQETGSNEHDGAHRLTEDIVDSSEPLYFFERKGKPLACPSSQFHHHGLTAPYKEEALKYFLERREEAPEQEKEQFLSGVSCGTNKLHLLARNLSSELNSVPFLTLKATHQKGSNQVNPYISTSEGQLRFTAEPALDLQPLFESRYKGWLGADVATSFLLPPSHKIKIKDDDSRLDSEIGEKEREMSKNPEKSNKRYGWIFGDTFIGYSNRTARLVTETIMVHNSIGTVEEQKTPSPKTKLKPHDIAFYWSTRFLPSFSSTTVATENVVDSLDQVALGEQDGQAVNEDGQAKKKNSHDGESDTVSSHASISTFSTSGTVVDVNTALSTSIANSIISNYKGENEITKSQNESRPVDLKKGGSKIFAHDRNHTCIDSIFIDPVNPDKVWIWPISAISVYIPEENISKVIFLVVRYTPTKDILPEEMNHQYMKYNLNKFRDEDLGFRVLSSAIYLVHNAEDEPSQWKYDSVNIPTSEESIDESIEQLNWWTSITFDKDQNYHTNYYHSSPSSSSSTSKSNSTSSSTEIEKQTTKELPFDKSIKEFMNGEDGEIITSLNSSVYILGNTNYNNTSSQLISRVPVASLLELSFQNFEIWATNEDATGNPSWRNYQEVDLSLANDMSQSFSSSDQNSNLQQEEHFNNFSNTFIKTFRAAPLFSPGTSEGTLFYSHQLKQWTFVCIFPYDTFINIGFSSTVVGPWNFNRIYEIPKIYTTDPLMAYAAKYHRELSSLPKSVKVANIAKLSTTPSITEAWRKPRLKRSENSSSLSNTSIRSTNTTTTTNRGIVKVSKNEVDENEIVENEPETFKMLQKQTSEDDDSFIEEMILTYMTNSAGTVEPLFEDGGKDKYIPLFVRVRFYSSNFEQ